MAELQLSYSFLTAPPVLEVGGDATLTIVVSNTKAPVTVTGIDFTLYDGPGARDLVNGVTPQTSQMPDGWTHPDPSGGKFSMSPSSAVQMARQGLLFTFAVTVNTEPGTATIDITEHLQVEDAGETDPRVNRGTLTIPKFPAGFALNGFYTTTPIINQGDSVTLVWIGQNLDLANYQISYSAAGTKKTVAIPANTYSYTLDDVDDTSVVYLHVSAVNATDTSFTLQAHDYPITVDPAILFFSSDVGFAAPGGNAVLTWGISDTVMTGTVSCLQSGQSWTLDTAGLRAGSLSVSTPAIAMTADYVLSVCESPDVVVASKALQIQVSFNIPRPSAAYGQFFTDAQATALASSPARLVTDIVIPALVDDIFSAFTTFYPDIDFYLDWENPAVNAQSFRFLDLRKKVVLFGGLARRSCLFYEGLVFIVAQSVARLSGLGPATSQQLTYCGAADYYATSQVTSQVYYAVSSDSDLLNGILKQITALFAGISGSDDQGDPNDLANDPAIGCRIAALSNGIFGEKMPSCVGSSDT